MYATSLNIGHGTSPIVATVEEAPGQATCAVLTIVPVVKLLTLLAGQVPSITVPVSLSNMEWLLDSCKMAA